jgi:hypothetical protein
MNKIGSNQSISDLLDALSLFGDYRGIDASLGLRALNTTFENEKVQGEAFISKYFGLDCT